jgi:tape measure domain-containing protein
MSEGNVQLKLRVNLDLVAFRKDLGKLAQAAAAYYYPVNLLINKKNFTAQLENIGRTLGTRKYNVDVNDTSIKTAAGEVDKLADKLKKLSGTININTNIGEAGGRPGTAMAVMARKLANQFKGDIDAAARQMQAMRGEAPFGKGTRSIPGFKAAAQGMGIENAFKLFFQELKTVDPRRLAKVLDDGSVMMMQENREIKQSLDAIQDKAKKLASDLSAMGDAAKTTGKASIERAGKALYPQNYGLKIASLLSSVEKLNSDLRKVSAASGVELSDPLNELSSVLRGLSNSFVDIAGFNRTLDETLRGFDTATKRATQATAAYAERIQRRAGTAPAQATAGPRLLSGQAPAGALAIPSREDPYRVIEAQVRNAFDIIEDYYKRQAESFANNYKKAIENYHRRTLSSIVRSMQVTDFGGPERPLMLPSAGGTTAGLNRPRVTTGSFTGRGYEPPGGFPSDTRPLGGRQGPATFIGPGGAMAQWKAALKGAEEAMSGFQTNSIPFIGGLKSIAMELGQATKQVLLYGTAYKGLAFITSLPGQIFNAVKAQQQYNNSLQVVTEGTGTYAKELLYIDQIQRTFGLDLEATRKGFTDLYASMAPTGFDSGSIEKLFTGISAASAALQLTPATMDRVIYAFAQMASKGQIMSEELKRQLGDALPGALGIFANAAGMSLQEFNKAMEAGEFTGAKFRETIAKVTDELIKRFGTGAQAAGRSLQGLTNTIKGDFIRTLESLAPVVDSVAQATLIPLSRVLKQFSSAASIAMGEMERLQNQIGKQKELLGELRVSGVDEKEIKKAEVALLALQSQYDQLKIALDDPDVKQQSENIKAFVKELQQLGTIVLNISQAIGSVLNPILTFFGTNLSQAAVVITSVILGFNAMKLSVAVAAFAMTVWNKVVLASAAGAAAKAAQVKLLQMAFQALGAKISIATLSGVKFGIALKALLVSTGIGAVVVGLGLLAAGFASVGNSARKAAEDAKASIQSIREAAASGNVALIEMKETEAKVNVAGIDAALKELDTAETRRRGRGGQRVTTVTESQAAGYRALGVDIEPGNRTVEALKKNLQAARQAQAQVLQSIAAEKPVAEARRKALGLESPQPGEFPDEGGDDQAAIRRAQAYLDAIERREEGMAKAREQLEERLADIRKNATEEVERIERQYADKRLSVEREIARVRRDIAFELQRQALEGGAALRIIGGESPDLVDLEKQILEAKRQFTEEEINRKEQAQDEEIRKARELEDFRTKIAKAINEANLRYAKQVGEVQRAYAQNVAKIISEGSGVAAKRLEAAGRLMGAILEVETRKQAYATKYFGSVLSLKGTERVSPAGIELVRQSDPERAKDLEHFNAALDRQAKAEEETRKTANAPFTTASAGAVALPSFDSKQFDTEIQDAQRGLAELQKSLSEALATKNLQNFAATFTRFANQQNDKLAGLTQTTREQNGELQAQLELRRGGLRKEEADSLARYRAQLNFVDKNLQGLVKQLEGETSIADAAQRAQQIEAQRLKIKKAFTGETALLLAQNRLYGLQLQQINEAEERANEQRREAIQLVEQSVSGAMSSYKEFLGAIVKGEGMKDALSRMQQAFRDQAVTLFFDFAMKPMEKMLKEQLTVFFGLETEEALLKRLIVEAEKQVTELKRLNPGLTGQTEEGSLKRLVVAAENQVTELRTLNQNLTGQGAATPAPTPSPAGVSPQQPPSTPLPPTPTGTAPGTDGTPRPVFPNRPAELQIVPSRDPMDDGASIREIHMGMGGSNDQMPMPNFTSPQEGRWGDFVRTFVAGVEKEIKGMANPEAARQLISERQKQLNDRLLDMQISTASTMARGTHFAGPEGRASINALNADYDKGINLGETMLGNLSQSLTQPIEDATKDIAQPISTYADLIQQPVKAIATAGDQAATASRTWQQNLGATVQAIGMAAASIASITAGISQLKKGGTSNVLTGIGSIMMGVGGALGGFSRLFPGATPAVPVQAAANGAVWQGGFRAFANGGVVNGPTLGLVGEGKYNEAIVPLPDGRSIPVKMAGDSSARSIMESNGQSSKNAPSTLSLSFETTKIGGVEYVSREQLELAMAATRKEAVREGASRGMNMTMDKIKNSPSTRNSLGMGRR